MPVVEVDITIVAQGVPADPVSGVLVRVYDSLGAAVVTEGTTDADGLVQFMLDGESPPTRYQLRTYKAGVAIPNPKYIDVYGTISESPTGTNTFILNDANVFTHPQSMDPKLCRLSGYIRDPAGRYRPGRDIHFIYRYHPLVVGDELILGEKVAVRTDRNGYIEVDLWRNGCYRAVIESHENAGRNIFVPDLPAANINHVLFPRPHRVIFDPAPPWAIAVDDELEVDVQVELSSGYVIDGTAQEDVEFSVEGDGVSLQVLDDRLVLRRSAAGTAALRITRLITSISYDPDEAVIGDESEITTDP
jgi:hypothetical protein